MYVIDTEIEVNWRIPANPVPATYDEYDVTVLKPDGSLLVIDSNEFEGTYTSSGILEEDYIVPDQFNDGAVTFPFTPDVEGVWTVILSTGLPGAHDIYYPYTLRVSSPETVIRQQVQLQ